MLKPAQLLFQQLFLLLTVLLHSLVRRSLASRLFGPSCRASLITCHENDVLRVNLSRLAMFILLGALSSACGLQHCRQTGFDRQMIAMIRM